MQRIESLEKTVNSAEYKKLLKCSEKTCKTYKKVLEKEMDLANELIKQRDEMKKIKDLKDIIKKAKKILVIAKELAKLKTDKKALMCVLDNCKNEYAEVITLKNKKMIGVFDKNIKMMK